MDLTGDILSIRFTLSVMDLTKPRALLVLSVLSTISVIDFVKPKAELII